MATDTVSENERILAEMRKSNADTAKLIEEANKLRNESAKFRSEAEKLRVETGKMARESTWYPAIVIATAVGAGAAFAKLFL